ncbi:cia30 family protein [Diplodia corticola]|uniref:Cia30 family protein n=1 Tax=Diplodia corticola TaxID=236234 RepID=A0A1J9SG28_9PEZI|nr:cia30 family protein [Diplodia corticola]OJD38764.1 cia30 family protein [Diplodia corticola]
MALETCNLFGGSLVWNTADWTSSDDRVRGGKSHSYFDISETKPVARFYGNLDIKTLGGAGFASQRTTGENRSWNIDGYDGIQIEIAESDAKKYTFNIKNELLPPDPDTGREQSTISYEYDFVAPPTNMTGATSTVFVPWEDFKATYRGREDPDAPPIDLTDIKRFSVMTRSFFGNQEGNFSLSIKSISAARNCSKDKEVIVLESKNVQPGDVEKGVLAGQLQEMQARAVDSPATRRLPPMSKVMYGALAALLGIWVLYPGTPHFGCHSKAVGP